jgi:hypothetical protein
MLDGIRTVVGSHDNPGRQLKSGTDPGQPLLASLRRARSSPGGAPIDPALSSIGAAYDAASLHGIPARVSSSREPKMRAFPCVGKCTLQFVAAT